MADASHALTTRTPLTVLTPDDPRNKRWALPPAVEGAAVDALQVKTGIPRLVNQLLVQRGVTDVDAARAFLAPKLEHLHDPFLLKGVGELIDRLVAAKARGAKIGIHGDYDVDGLGSTTLYATVLTKLGFDVDPFVPHRMIDGYGVSVRAIKQWHETGVRVILTCDTGFSAIAEVAKAVDEYGLEVLITDHHLPPEVLPKAHALVNPTQKGCPYPNKALCGAGVAFKVLQALCRTMGLDEKEVLWPHLDLVALPTVCDVVSLTGENRVLVRHGIRAVRRTENLGLRALLDVAKVNPEDVDEGTFGWVLGPRLNAVGRIDDAGKGLKLLLAKTEKEAVALAEEIDQLNSARKTLSKAIEETANKMIGAMDLEDVYGIALFSPHGDETVPGLEGGAPVVEWHHGVIGIVASRLVERTGRPVFLFAYDETSGKWKGSGRAPSKRGAIHLRDGLDAVKRTHPELLDKFGGHAAAAGATLCTPTATERRAFATAFNEAMRGQMRPEDRHPILFADLEVGLADLTKDFFGLLQKFAPFGHGNEPINMIAREVRVTAARAIGADKSHLKLTVTQPGAPALDAIAFGFAARFPESLLSSPPYTVDLFFRLEENEYRGEVSLQLMIEDVLFNGLPAAVTVEAVPAARPLVPSPEPTRPPQPVQHVSAPDDDDDLGLGGDGILGLFAAAQPVAQATPPSQQSATVGSTSAPPARNSAATTTPRTMVSSPSGSSAGPRDSGASSASSGSSRRRISPRDLFA